MLALTAILAACGGKSEQQKAAEEMQKSAEAMQKSTDSMSKGAEDMAKGMEAMALLSDVVPNHVRPHLGLTEPKPTFELSRRYWIPAHVRPPRAATVQGSEMRMSPIG